MTEYNKTQKKDIQLVDPRIIKFDPKDNPRKVYGNMDELKASIAVNGVHEPIKIKNTPTGPILIHGFRRMTAVMDLINSGTEIARVPCIPVARGYGEDEALLDHLICNSGKSLTPMEEADVIATLIAHGFTQAEVATKIGKTQSSVSNILKLATTTKTVQKYMNDGIVSATTVIRLITECHENQKVVEQKLTAAVKALAENKKKKVSETAVTARVSKNHKLFEGWILALREHNVDAEKIAKAETLFNLIENASNSDEFIDKFLGIV